MESPHRQNTGSSRELNDSTSMSVRYACQTVMERVRARKGDLRVASPRYDLPLMRQGRAATIHSLPFLCTPAVSVRSNRCSSTCPVCLCSSVCLFACVPVYSVLPAWSVYSVYCQRVCVFCVLPACLSFGALHTSLPTRSSQLVTASFTTLFLFAISQFLCFMLLPLLFHLTSSPLLCCRLLSSSSAVFHSHCLLAQRSHRQRVCGWSRPLSSTRAACSVTRAASLWSTTAVSCVFSTARTMKTR